MLSLCTCIFTLYPSNFGHGSIGSPLKIITEDQVDALQSTLPKGWRVFYAMRYGQPSVASVLDAIVREGIRDLVVVPMYPQYAGPTTGTA